MFSLVLHFFFYRQREHLEDLLRNLTPERIKIGDAMFWAIDHAEAADEIIDCITEALSIAQTPAFKKVTNIMPLIYFFNILNFFSFRFLDFI